MGISFGENAQLVECVTQDGEQVVQPVVDTRLTQAEQLGHNGLQRIRLEVDQHEQQLLVRAGQGPSTAPTGAALTWLPGQGLEGFGIMAVVGLAKGGQQEVELREGQTGERQKLSRIRPQLA